MRLTVLLAAVLVCALLPRIGNAELVTFDNTANIIIVDDGVANPYPSAIDVSGITGSLNKITITLFGVSHTFPDDMAAVVVAPSNTAALLFSGPGSGVPASNLNWIFDDSAAAPLPVSGALASGTFQPGLEEYDEFFPAPGPGGKLVDSDPAPWNFDFTPWLSENPNGQWDLFVMDSLGGDSGSISGGWSITFDVAAVPEPSSLLSLSVLAAVGIFRRRRDL